MHFRFVACLNLL